MDTLEYLTELDIEDDIVPHVKRERILDDHRTVEDRDDTIDMTYIQLYHWLGY